MLLCSDLKEVWHYSEKDSIGTAHCVVANATEVKLGFYLVVVDPIHHDHFGVLIEVE